MGNVNNYSGLSGREKAGLGTNGAGSGVGTLQDFYHPGHFQMNASFFISVLFMAGVLGSGCDGWRPVIAGRVKSREPSPRCELHLKWRSCRVVLRYAPREGCNGLLLAADHPSFGFCLCAVEVRTSSRVFRRVVP